MMEETASEASGVTAVLTDSWFSQLYRECLERMGILDNNYRLQKQPGGLVAIPVLEDKLTESILDELRENVAPGSVCSVTQIKNPVFSKRARVQSPAQELREELHSLVEQYGITWDRDLERDLPHSWQFHGDLVLLSEDCFTAPMWTELGSVLWETVATTLGAERLAKQGHVSTDGFRSPTVTLLLGDNNWVEHVDNGIKYVFDVTRCMFSRGNITEKMRISSMSCSGEVVVDLYAGIGYFTLPFLVHAGAAFVHACEWNPHATAALRKNLDLNGVSDRCQIHECDNKQLDLQNVADRVNLGLIPSSREGWPIACRVLRQDTGGILHIHENVESFGGKSHPGSSSQEQYHCSQQVHSKGKVCSATMKADQPDQNSDMCTLEEAVPDIKETALKPEWQQWAESTGDDIGKMLFELTGQTWKTQILHIEHVKSYAPHVDHMVLDLECRPSTK
ncbi:tRNA wybutosine-synthesizing protein 2 homolog [Ambystoma mexicanum]|uniref:tRNA wybutosine-synthesizing protein 2 homolog n=1 Tax=Ambystoma mexicanum TaxID=8296 RepID=UPI0037E6F852